MAESDPVVIEPERYEFRESPRHWFDVDRRGFMRLFGLAGGGLIVAATVPLSAQQESGRGGFQGGAQPTDLASWLHIDEEGRITAYTGKVEIGQNIRTSLAQAVAGELHVPIATVSMVMADTALTPYDMGTFGSRTTPTMAPVLAKAAATAREMLIDRAASLWHVDRAGLTAADGAIHGPGNHRATYGELTRGQQLAGTVSAEVTPASAWTLRGTPVPKVNAADIVRGRHAYTPDITRPGLMMGRLIRPPAYGATIASVDEAKARAMAGVTVVRDGEFLGVVAPNERVLTRAVAAVNVQWRLPAGLPSSDTVYAYLTSHVSADRRGGGGRTSGDVTAARAGAARTFDATYHIPYIAHVPLEPHAAVAEWTGGTLTVWAGTQRPFGVRTELAQAFHLAEDAVRVITPDMGSGYGGKHTGEHAVEAARLAQAVGKPVKIVYTRPEEFMWAYFRPAGVIAVRAAVDAHGQIVAWEFDNYLSGSAALNTPYRIANQRIAYHDTDTPLRVGSYRGLAATANHYVREMHMDAIARAVGQDAVQFRLAHIDDARLRAVLTTAAQKAGWPHPSQPGRAVGIACGTEKGSYLATVAEVEKGSGAPGAAPFVVRRLVVVFECGAIVNPEGLRNQVEGAVVQGLGGALFEAIQFADGKILNGSMGQYRVPRFKDVPPIETTLLDRKDIPSAGAGETPIVCVAPAIGSAVRAFGAVAPKLPITLTT